MQGFDLISALVKETVVGWVHRYGVEIVTVSLWLVLLGGIMLAGWIVNKVFKRKSKRKD